jgi:hypothetical protein
MAVSNIPRSTIAAISKLLGCAVAVLQKGRPNNSASALAFTCKDRDALNPAPERKSRRRRKAIRERSRSCPVAADLGIHMMGTAYHRKSAYQATKREVANRRLRSGSAARQWRTPPAQPPLTCAVRVEYVPVHDGGGAG